MQLISSTVIKPINILCGSIGYDKCFALEHDEHLRLHHWSRRYPEPTLIRPRVLSRTVKIPTDIASLICSRLLSNAAGPDRQPHDERFFRWRIWTMDRKRKRTKCSGCLPPWEAYHRALCDAQAARGHFLRKGFFATITSLKNRICYQAREWNIRICSLCC